MAKLSERVRPGSEAAPWVVDEIGKLEAALEMTEKRAEEAYQYDMAQVYAVLMNESKKVDEQRERADKAEADLITAAAEIQDLMARCHAEAQEKEQWQKAAVRAESEWTFVPDQHGGHMLSRTGDKWYPEAFLRTVVDAANRDYGIPVAPGETVASERWAALGAISDLEAALRIAQDANNALEARIKTLEARIREASERW